MTPTVPRWARHVADVLFYAGVLVLVSVPIGLFVSAAALPQPVAFVGDFDSWDTAAIDEFKRDLDVTNMRRTP